MDQLEFGDTLKQKAKELNQKAEQARQAKNVEAEVTRAKDNIRDLNREVDSLDSQLDELQFYVDVLQMFDDNQSPDMVEEAFDVDSALSDVDEALRKAQNASDISEDELLDAAENRQVRSLTQEVNDAGNTVTGARGSVIEEIRKYQRYWEDEIDSARDLNQIIGGGASDFDQVLSKMESFLSNDIWNPEKESSSLVTRWQRLLEKWEANAGRHGWDAFQQEHDLTDDTIEALQQFADRRSIRLDELSVSVIEELKSVEELESAIRMEIDTR